MTRQRNVGSDASPQQIARAENTAIGNLRGTISASSSAAPISSEPRMSVPKQAHGRASLEGYQYAPRADIQMNGSGYSNPAAQKARMSRNRPDISSARPATLDAGRRTSRVADLRGAGCNKGSIGKLSKIMKKR